jgi:hypothetical protein
MQPLIAGGNALIETLKEIAAAAPSSSRPVVASLTSVDKNYGDVPTMICLGIARIGFQRDLEKMYG